MLLAGAGNAWAVDYWVVGPAVGGWDQWKKMNQESTTRYTFTVNTGEFKITKANNWDNANRLDNIGCNDNNDTYKGNVTCNGANNHSANVAGTLCFNPNDSYMWIESSGTPSTELTRIVAGTPASVFGTEWDPSNTNNKMTETSSGVYTIDYYTNFQNNTAIKFKVTDGSWSNAWPSSDKPHTINKGCQKTTVTYNTNGNTVDVSTVPSDHCCTKPSAPQISGATSICSGESAEITVSGYSSSNTYTLYEGTTKQTNTISNGKFTVNSTGKYYVTVTTCAESDPSNEVEISAKAVASAAGYNLKTKTAEWNGSAISVEIETNSGYPSIENIYYDGSLEAPSAVGTYPITIDVNSNSTYCSKSGIEIGTFTITCPAPAEVPKFEVTQHEVVCGNTNIQKGIIKITNPVADYKYRLGNEGYTEYTLDANNSITGIDGGTKYRISAVRYCGTAKSSTTNEEKYAEISKTDVKLTPTLTSTPIIKCGEGDNAYSPGTLVITNYNANYDYTIAPNVGEPTIEGTNATYSINAQVATEYTVIATHKEYNCSSVQAKTTVALTDNTPTLEEISISSNVQIVCAGDNNVTLTCNLVGAVGTPTYKWTKNGEPVGDNSNTIQAGVLERNTTFSVSVILDNSGCTKEFTISKELEVKVRPEAPNLGSTGKTICYGTLVNLPMVDNNDANNQINWYNGKLVKPTNVPVLETTTFYAEAVSENGLGCSSNDKTPYTVTVNALPTITEISGNNSAVLYEDVELTATGVTQGAEVRWYLGNDDTSVATGATYVVTSENAGEVIVKAKAFLNGCESAVATKTVTFGEETCKPTTITVPANYIEIYCKYNDAPTQHDMKVDIWKQSEGQGTESYQSCSKSVDGYAYWKFNITDDATYCIRISNKELNYKSGFMCTLTRGHKYYFDIPGNWSGWTGGPDKSKTKDITETQDGPPAITAPAVKTVSATSEEGSGVVKFTGQIIKTGCAATSKIYYGYQFKKADEEWPTSDIEASNTPEALKLIPCTNASATALNYQFSANVEGLENGNYHFRAYIINGYNFTNGNYNQGVYYGLDKLVSVSTTKTPISNVTLNYCDENGGSVGVDPNPMCKGATAYVKLEYAGSNYSDIKWLVEGVETNLVTDKGDGVWSYIIQGTGHLSVELRNDANKDNEDNPTWATSDKLSFTMKAEPAAPYISIDPASGIICEGSSATIKVENPSADCSYKLVEERFEPYKSGDLKYTVQNVGKYYVVAQHNECTANEYTSNQVAINQIISTNANISIDPAKAETTPWEPVTITVKPDAGYIYELSYTDGNLAAVDGVRIKQNGDSYTYYIPRPDSWGTGNATSARETVNYGIEAQLKVDGEESTCKLKAATAIIQLKDEENEDCD